MELPEIAQAVLDLGGYLGICIVLLYFNHAGQQKHTDQLEKMNTAHKEEMLGLIQAIATNTAAITELATLIKEGGYKKQ